MFDFVNSAKFVLFFIFIFFFWRGGGGGHGRAQPVLILERDAMIISSELD